MADKRKHTFNAEANSLGGTIISPINEDIPAQANVSLPSVGGVVVDTKGEFHHHKIVSVDSTHCHVVGSESKKHGGWATLSTSVVENLSILEIVNADRVVSRVSLEHPAEGYTPKITLVGSNFINLQIAGFPVKAVLNFSLLAPHDEYPTTSWLENPAFLDAVRQQHRRRAKDSPVAKEVEERFGWVETQEGISKRGYVVCSLVDRIEGDFPGTTSGNMVHIPQVGRFFFGEFIVYQNSFNLTMIRAELGCPVHGGIGVGTGAGNGSTYP